MSDEDDGPHSVRTILEREMENALTEMRRPTLGLFISGLSAGLNVSFGALFTGAVLTLSTGFPSPLVQHAVLGFASALGFLFVVIGQTELFTAHTTLAVLPVLDRRASVRELGRLWGVVYVANLVGCAAFAALVAALGPNMGIASAAAYGSLSDTLLSVPSWAIVLSGVVAGWLMGLVTWLAAASRDTIGRIAIVVSVTAAIGFGPFHHALLGSTEVLAAMLLGTGPTPLGFLDFLLWTTLGNVVGGSVFVALLNYGHAALAADDADVDFESETDA